MIRSLKKVTRKVGKILLTLSEDNSKSNIPDSWKQYKDYIDIHPSVIIAPSSTIKIFNPPVPAEICLEIGEGSHIFSSFNLLRPKSKIKVGKNCQMGMVNFICADEIIIGDDVMMAWGITIMDNDSHSIVWENRKNDVKQCYFDYLKDNNNFIKNKDWANVSIKKITIGNKAWVGFNVSILKGVNIGSEVCIGACSVVTKDLPDYAIAAGNPAKVIRIEKSL